MTYANSIAIVFFSTILMVSLINKNINMRTPSFKILTKSTMLLMVLLSLLITTYYVKAAIGGLLLTIDNPTSLYNEKFGSAIAVTPNGDLLVGAPFDDAIFTDTGSVYLFNGITGELKLTINNPTPEPGGERFGASVATTPNGDLLIGAIYDNSSEVGSGSVYLFDGTTGALKLTINNPTPKQMDSFGASVAVTPNGNLLVGAPADDTGASNAGSAYLFDNTTGALLLTVNNPTPQLGDLFGEHVATTPNGDILISARLDDTIATDTGSVYLFDGTTGALKLTISNPYPEKAYFFGFSVAITPNGDLLVGAYNNYTLATLGGSAYLFDGITGELLITMDSPAIEYNNFFGFSVVATLNGDLLIGAPRDGISPELVGSVYLFGGIHSQPINTPPTLDLIGNKIVTEGQLLEFTITASDSDNDNLTFSASNLPAGATFDTNTATFSWVPSFEDAGNYTDVEFTVTDDGTPMELDVELVTITVGNVNRAPIFDFVGPQEIQEETLLEFVVVATDLDTDIVTLSTSVLPVGAIFNAETGVFVWTPDLTQGGVYVVSFFATDNGTPSETAQLDVVITVGDNPTPVEQAVDIVDSVVLADFATNIENSYLSNLKKVEKFIEDGKITPALNQLYAFINKAENDLANGIIDQITADVLINSANALINVLSE